MAAAEGSEEVADPEEDWVVVLGLAEEQAQVADSVVGLEGVSEVAVEVAAAAAWVEVQAVDMVEELVEVLEVVDSRDRSNYKLQLYEFYVINCGVQKLYFQSLHGHEKYIR